MLASVKLALEQCETPSESQRVLQEFETARGVVETGRLVKVKNVRPEGSGRQGFVYTVAAL